MPHAFISYNDDVKDIAENLRERLGEYDIDVWMFSRDRTPGEVSWNELTEKIKESHVLLFFISKRTIKSKGQLRELGIAQKSGKKFFPVVAESVDFTSLPAKFYSLQRVSGISIDSHNIRSKTLEIVRVFFPEFGPSKNSIRWVYPKPGDWLEICNIDQYTEKYLKLGDEVYFRRVSPMGLFECYAPQISELFWFWPPNLKPASFIDEDGAVERETVPRKYQILGMFEAERKGWEALG